MASAHQNLSYAQSLDEHRATAARVGSSSTQSLPLGHCGQPTKERDLRKIYPEGAVFPLKWKNISSFISFPYTKFNHLYEDFPASLDVPTPFPRCMATSLIQSPDHWQWLWKWRMILAAISTLHFCTFLGVFIRLSKSLYSSFVSVFFFYQSLVNMTGLVHCQLGCAVAQVSSGILKTTFSADLYETQHSVLQIFGNGINFHLKIEKYLDSEFEL